MSKQHTKLDSEKRPDPAGDTQAPAAPSGASPAQPSGEAAAQGPSAEALAKELAAREAALADRDARIKALEGEVSSLKDQYLRKLADYENFRKRMFREKDDAVLYANTQILQDLVGVLDNFDRAAVSSETSRDWQTLHDGVTMIHKSLFGLLESKYGLARYDSLGVAFDPNLHEAVMSEQGECQEPVVIEEFVKGYKLRDRILRGAKVKVRMPLPATSQDTSREANA